MIFCIICLQETCLEDDRTREDLEIETYELHLNSNGKGKGIAIYFKKNMLKHEIDIKHQHPLNKIKYVWGNLNFLQVFQVTAPVQTVKTLI